MELKAAYDEVRARLDALDFSALWRGFRPTRFALYNGEACCFDGAYVEKTEDFVANTSILYRGEHIAIWNLSEEPEDLDVLASCLAHEMFHAFQRASGESRWANEMDALARYRYDAGNISMRLAESERMRAILLAGRDALFPELLALRRARSARFPYEYAYEARIEQIEGSANDVELRALAMLDAEKGRRGWERALGQIARAERYVPTRVISYLTGAALLACIRRCSTYDYAAFTDVPFAEGVLTEAEGSAPPVARSADAEAACADYEAETRRIIDGALAKNRIVLCGKFPLVSLNIWDARRSGKYAVSNLFLAYQDGGQTRNLEGSFVAELDGEGNVLTVYEQ
ncbi:MAG: hypothetical protein E7425_04090 [Ruminococcaceae bacterium]|nr:hypothetical protein [Oscillospiraceae bacterium]